MKIISGIYGGRRLKTTTGPGYRPATSRVREALFSMLEARGADWPSARVLDIYAGSGSLGIEALSRGAVQACFIEKERKAAHLISENLKDLQVEENRYVVLNKDAFQVLRKPPKSPFQIIFIDPPYGFDLLGKTLEAVLKFNWPDLGGIVTAEIESRAEIPDTALPSGAETRLEPFADRLYGQTRILVWQVVRAAADGLSVFQPSDFDTKLHSKLE